MSKYRITAPDGKDYIVEGGGSQEEALAHFQSTWKPNAPVAAPTTAPTPTEKNGGAANLLSGGDAMLTLGTGAVAAPVSGLAGILGTILPGPSGQGAAWQKSVSDLLQFSPKTQGGELITQAASVPFDLLNKGAVALGEKAQDSGAGPLASTAIQTAVETVPTMVAPLAPKAMRGPLDSSAKSLMRQALNPRKSEVLKGNADSAILTMLEDGTMPTKGGLEKMRGEIDNLNSQIEQAIKGSNASVNKVAVARVLVDKLNQIKKQVNPDADIAAIKKSWVEFVDHPLLQNSNLIPVQLAQELKQGTYRALNRKNAYGEAKSGDVEAQKTMARGLKEGIAKKVPSVVDLNARESALINAADLLENRLAVTGNRGLGFGALSPHPGNLMAWLLDRTDLAKGALAQTLYRGSRPGSGPALMPEAILGALQARED